MASRERATVLFVDDEPLVRSVAVRLLEQVGHQVVGLADPEEAIDYYRSHRGEIGVVVLDLGSSGPDGRRCRDELVAIDPAVKLVVISSDPEPDLGPARQGSPVVLRKPFRATQLVATIERALGRKSGARPTGQPPDAAQGRVLVRKIQAGLLEIQRWLAGQRATDQEDADAIEQLSSELLHILQLDQRCWGERTTCHRVGNLLASIQLFAVVFAEPSPSSEGQAAKAIEATACRTGAWLQGLRRLRGADEDEAGPSSEP